MKELKFYTSWAKRTKALSDAEFGRLVIAMLRYAYDGSSPALGGRESLLWDEFKEEIDRQRTAYDNRVAGLTKARASRWQQIETDYKQIGTDYKQIETDYRDNLSFRESTPPTTPGKETPAPLKKTSPKGESKESSLSPAIEQALKDFKDMRNRMRKPMTQLAVDLLIQKLEKLAPGDEKTQVAILMQSIENGWTGVYELKQEQKKDRQRNTLLNYKETGESHANLSTIAFSEDEL